MFAFSPRPKNKSLGKKLFTALVIIIIIAGFIACGWFLLGILNPLTLPQNTFIIIEGEGVNQISNNLKNQGLIRNQFIFETYAYLKDIEGNFQTGEYLLPSVVNIKRLTEILTTGQSVKEWDLTVPEGFTLADIAARVSGLVPIKVEDFYSAVGSGKASGKTNIDLANYDFLADKPAKASLEGYLFPDTYRFFAYATVDDVVRKMLMNFDKKLTPDARAAIAEQDKKIFDIITMASIIEREVRTDQDRAIISGIFWKRLDIGMALQADSTINYVTGKKTPSVSSTDLELDSLYNTYKYPGLPPGPICNPGLASINAAIYPEASAYWYFLTDDHGAVHYARDFEEHKANKAQYLK
jgi:UPF0755 protein